MLSVRKEDTMENLLPLLLVLACPLGMAAIGAVGWLWAQASGRR
jgi:hypothetical protein